MPAPTKRDLEQKVEQYKNMWIRQVEITHKAQCKAKEMRAVIVELYYSSFWDSDRLQDGTAEFLWGKVKEVFELIESGPNRITINDPKAGD